jgi:FkbM family methyltransferase
MAMNLRTLASRVVAATPLAYFPVRVRAGPAKGARWTLAPFSYNWRRGGERDLAAGLERLRNTTGATCWDFGAHFGIHSVGMAMQVGPTGQVAAFEPDPGAFRRLQYHVTRNDLRNIRLFNAAVSNAIGSSKLITTHGLGSSMSHFQYEDEQVSAHTPTVEVSTVVPDKLVFEGKIRPPDLIKVDIQGHGAKALQGSIESIRSRLPVIIFSNHSEWELEGTRKLLAPLGYEVFNLAGQAVDWSALDTNLGGDAALLVPPQR